MAPTDLASLLRAHLRRLSLTSWVLMIVGLALPFTLNTEFAQSCASMLIGWSIVNLIISFGSSKSKAPGSPQKLREVLMLNQGLNVAYTAVGVTMFVLGPPSVAGTGIALTLHGLNLLVLDGIFLRSVKSPTDDRSDF